MNSGLQTIPNVLQPIDKNRRNQYNADVRIYYLSQQAIRPPGTFAFMFTNIGDQICRVNGMVVYPGTIGSILGDSRTVSTAFEGYEYVGNIIISFDPAGGGANPALELVTLFYPQD